MLFDWHTWAEMISSPFMQRSLIVAVIVGLTAPVIGTYLVQRKLSLLGDGIGHVALTGVALGWLIGNITHLGNNDQFALPGAIVMSVVGAIIIEVMRAKGGAEGDVAIALLFYGGIATGALVISLAGGSTNHLNSYLFGSIASVSTSDLYISAALGAIILAFGIGLKPALFSLCQDQEYATTTGLPVWFLTASLAIVSALTVATAMRVVGVLLVSALMIVPVAISQLYARSFNAMMYGAMLIGLVMCILGLGFSYLYNSASGSAIVVGLVLLYTFAACLRPLISHLTRREVHFSPANVPTKKSPNIDS